MKGNHNRKRKTEITLAIEIMIIRPTTAFPRLLRIGTPPFNRPIGKRIRPKIRINAAGNIISNSVTDIGKNDK
ncbi:MAG: hypothetical protein O7B32_00390 [Thaumarchaeota archaeon]|nr:hypothetical protein [Nitrososphaerota archaeon]